MSIKDRIVSPEKAIEAAVALVQIAGIPWMREPAEDDSKKKRDKAVSFAQFDFGAGFAECTLSIGFDGDVLATQQSDDNGVYWSIQRPRIQVILGMDRFTPTQLAASMPLWSQVNHVASLIQATLEKMTIGYKI